MPGHFEHASPPSPDPRNMTKGPTADQEITKKITKQHAQGHDELDRHGIPRFREVNSGRSETLSIRERIQLLAEKRADDAALDDFATGKDHP